MRFVSRFFDTNDREVSRVQPLIHEVNEGEEPSEDELHHADSERRSDLRKARRKRENEAINGALDDVIPEVFAAAREASKRTLGMRHFDVQLIGGVVLHQGKIAEMKTGEGKTLV